MSSPSLRLHYGWVVLMVATLVVFGSLGLARSGYTAVLFAMQVGLGIDNTQAGVLATANLVGYLALSVIGGAPAALGFITFFFGLGQTVGPSVAGVMADAAGTFFPAFLLAAGVALLGALGALLLRPVSLRHRPVLQSEVLVRDRDEAQAER